jgi:hypothetical protein
MNILQSKALQNLAKLGLFGLKTNHLATQPGNLIRSANTHCRMIGTTKKFRLPILWIRFGRNFRNRTAEIGANGS